MTDKHTTDDIDAALQLASEADKRSRAVFDELGGKLDDVTAELKRAREQNDKQNDKVLTAIFHLSRRVGVVEQAQISKNQSKSSGVCGNTDDDGSEEIDDTDNTVKVSAKPKTKKRDYTKSPHFQHLVNIHKKHGLNLGVGQNTSTGMQCLGAVVGSYERLPVDSVVSATLELLKAYGMERSGVVYSRMFMICTELLHIISVMPKTRYKDGLTKCAILLSDFRKTIPEKFPDKEAKTTKKRK
jgi:hypothetical protein